MSSLQTSTKFSPPRLGPGRMAILLPVLALPWLLPAPSARGASFVRGDTDANGSIEISDSIRILGFLFLGSPASLPCADAADVNDDGEVDIADGIFGLSFLFTGGRQPSGPFPDCGQDSTADRLTCQSFRPCACDESVPGPLTTVHPSRSHGLRFVPGSGQELIAVYIERSEVWAQRMAGEGALRGSRVLVASALYDFDAVSSGATIAVAWLSGGNVYATLLSAADLSTVTPETRLFFPGASADQVRLNYDASRGTLIVAIEGGGALSAITVPTPALRPAPAFPRFLSLEVTRHFDVLDTGSPAYVFFTLDTDGSLHGERLKADGSRDGKVVRITTGAGADVEPAVARDGETIGLVYGHSEPGADRLRFVVLDADLSPLRGPIDLPGMSDPSFLLHDPPGVDVAAAAAHLGGGRFLVTALNKQVLAQNHWYAYEILPEDRAPGRLTFRRLHPEPCGGGPCLEEYTSVAAGAAGERALVGSTRKSGGDSARVTALDCP